MNGSARYSASTGNRSAKAKRRLGHGEHAAVDAPPPSRSSLMATTNRTTRFSKKSMAVNKATPKWNAIAQARNVRRTLVSSRYFRGKPRRRARGLPRARVDGREKPRWRLRRGGRQRRWHDAVARPAEHLPQCVSIKSAAGPEPPQARAAVRVAQGERPARRAAGFRQCRREQRVEEQDVAVPAQRRVEAKLHDRVGQRDGDAQGAAVDGRPRRCRPGLPRTRAAASCAHRAAAAAGPGTSAAVAVPRRRSRAACVWIVPVGA